MFLRLLLSLIFSVVTFKIFYTFFPMIFLTILVSILGLYGFWKIYGLIFSSEKNRDTKKSDDTERDKRSSTIQKEGIAKLRNIRSNTRLISDNAVAEKVQTICKTGLEIFDYIEKNPDDINKARQFINYYLDTTEKIVLQYVELSSKKNPGEDVLNTLKKVEDVLDSILKTYDKQLKNLLEDDLLDLNTEIQVLEKTIQLEG